MRVLNTFPDPRLGGPQQRSLRVARGLRQFGVETDFLIPDGTDEFARRVQEEGFAVHQCDLPRIRRISMINENVRFLLSFRNTVSRVQSIIADTDVDVVHVNTPINYAPAYAAYQSDAALMWHFNDTLTPTPVRQGAAVAARCWADEIAVASDAVDEYFFDASIPTRTIYAPVDLEEFDPRATDGSSVRGELGLSSGTLVIGTVGNLNPVKGHDTLIESIPDVITENGDVVVLLAGQVLESRRDYADRLRKLVSHLNVKDSVQFLGWREDIPALLDAFDVFVLPSVSEACPTVVLEAMAMETPVVATNVGGVSEQVPDADHGWVVPPEDPAALASALTDALSSSPERIRRAANARKRAEEVFSLNACVEHHNLAYRSAVLDN